MTASGASPTAVLGTVIVTHREPALALACARSLRGEVSPERTVFVVNDPQACDVAAVEDLESEGVVLRNSSPHGYGENLNIGRAALPPDVEAVLLLNDDLEFLPGSVAMLASMLTSDPNLGVVGGAVIDAQHRPQAATFAFPSIGSELAQAVILPASLSEALRRRMVAVTAVGGPHRVDWVLGAAMLVRTAAFDAVGGFDRRFFLYSEETDFCWRLTRAGWGVAAHGGATIRHLGGASTGREHTRLMARSRATYLRRHWSQRRRAALMLGLALTDAWNFGYVACRIALAPWRAREKARLLRAHRLNRPRGFLP